VRAFPFHQLGFDPARLVFIDESNAKTNMTRLPDPEGKAPLRQCTSKPLADNDHDLLDAPGWLDGLQAIEGATDTKVFRAYVRQVLCPTLRPGDLVQSNWPRGSGEIRRERGRIAD
jgi:hypothetical protein